jgi:hypothetical protein
MFATACCLALSWHKWIRSMPHHPIALRYILILSFHLRLGLPRGLFPTGLPTKNRFFNLRNSHLPSQQQNQTFDYKSHTKKKKKNCWTIQVLQKDTCHSLQWSTAQFSRMSAGDNSCPAMTHTCQRVETLHIISTLIQTNSRRSKPINMFVTKQPVILQWWSMCHLC